MASPSSRKEALFAAGKQLILSKGYTATTVDEIVTNVGITKGAFYYFFKSKEAFAQELLEYNWSPIRKMQEELSDSNLDPLHHLHQHIDFMVEFLPGDGRLMGIMSQELSDTNPEIGGQVRSYFREWTQYLQRIIELAKAQYVPNAEFTPQSLMEFILMTIEGVPVIARQLGNDAIERSVQHLKRYVNDLFQPTL
jgi:TetR/AcrR family transcriptional regulator, transcriptional repressor for nem operon